MERNIFRHRRPRFFEFIQPLPPIADNADAQNAVDPLASFILDDDPHYYLGPCCIGLLQAWIKASAAVLNAFLLLYTLTATSLRNLNTEFQLSSSHVLILPIWKALLAFLIIVFGRFICRCIVAAIAFTLSCCRKARMANVIARSVQSAVGTYVWVSVMYHFITTLTDYGRRPLTTAFSLFAAWQGERILFRIFRTTIYVKWFDRKAKEAAFHCCMMGALLGPTGCRREEVERAARCGCLGRWSRRTALEYSAGRLPQHVEDRILLAKIDDGGGEKAEFEGDKQSDILREVSRAFPAIADGAGR